MTLPVCPRHRPDSERKHRDDLVAIINDAKAVEVYALSALENGSYTYDEDNDRYYLNNGDDLYERWLQVYRAFSEWLAK